MKNVWRWFGALLLIVGFAGCGFHPRQPLVLAPDLENMYIDSKNPNGTLVQALIQELHANDVYVSKTPQIASAILRITQSNQANQATGFIGASQASIYTLTNSVTFEVIARDGTKLYGPVTLRASQDYSTNATQSLSNDYVVRNKTEALNVELARQILNRLTQVNPREN
ncbi:MAG: hypothetical protein EBX40_02905 [Gammaproteobacteria bacterium]|nr:hypothetical protein [Gammaproteobacteria bacterium]